MDLNEVLEKLPKHLLELIIDQPYNEYTSQDHAVWRYVMRRNVDYLQHLAHHSYIGGLKKTGISIDSIPHMYGMNRILKEIGWAAVAVDGFIPPAAFMEFQAYNVLVIAADIRPIDQIEYTPAPDIIHEAAGHAPIIADPEYAEYLRYFGKIGSGAFSSAKDHELYEGIRHLSILKADPYTGKEEIKKAEEHLLFLEKNMGPPSEMALIRNLHWWTVEYGLIGNLLKPKIYGAGLLSSIGESYKALKNEVNKIPYTLDAKDYDFDITSMQPQLFVTPDFKTLTNVLDEFASQMAFKTGGSNGINKAIESKNLATCTFSSGIQVSGIFSDVITVNESPVYLKTSGPTQLSYNYNELPGHGKSYHAEGFGSPVGRLKNHNTPLRFLSDGELENLEIIKNKKSALYFNSGVTVKGFLKNILRKEGKIILMSFTDCTVKLNGHILFEPSWGVYDMAVGDEITSAFSGPADPEKFKMQYPVPKEKTHKIIHSKRSEKLHSMYAEIRKFRKNIFSNNNKPGLVSQKEIKQITQNQPGTDTAKSFSNASVNRIIHIWNSIKEEYPEEWLLPLEISEVFSIINYTREENRAIEKHLLHKASDNSTLNDIISNGLKLIPKQKK